MKIRKTIVRRRRAFTLLELLIVIVILGVLVAVIARNFFGSAEGAKEDTTRVKIKVLGQQLDVYRLHMDTYPESLAALLEQPSDTEQQKKWRGPYVDKEQLVDAWNHEFEYKFPGQYNQNTFDLSSRGKDNQAGTDDDLKNWEKT